MRQLGISVTCKFTKALEDGSFKTVSFSSEAQLDEGEDASEARRTLYAQVAEDLKTVFSNNGKKRTKAKSPDYPEPPIPKGTKTGKPGKNPDDKPWCRTHECPMQEHTKKSKNGKTQRWYSHRLGDGSWCNGRAKKEKK